MAGGSCIPITRVLTSAFTIPTESSSESDGTLTWDRTTLVVTEVHAAGRTGLGYSYADKTAAALIHNKLRAVVIGKDALDIPVIHTELLKEVRNIGRPGIASHAIAALDIALWDL